MRVSQVILTPERTARELLEAMANRLTFLDNFKCRLIEIPDSGPADTDFVIEHNLDTIPLGYIAMLNMPGTVYDGDRLTWTNTEATIRCSASNALITLVVF